MFIQTETTPNPNSLKFLPGIEITGGEPVSYINAESTQDSPLAKALFAIENVQTVFLGKDFITITKSTDGSWDILKPELLVAIMDHFVGGGKVFIKMSNSSESKNNENDSDVIKQIKEIIETRVRPAVAMDGGDIIFKNFENGIVQLELHGSCSGCPSSTITLKNGIESMLKHYVPEVISVEAVN